MTILPYSWLFWYKDYKIVMFMHLKVGICLLLDCKLDYMYLCISQNDNFFTSIFKEELQILNSNEFVREFPIQALEERWQK